MFGKEEANGRAAALIYKACNESGSPRTQSEICSIANVSEVTLRGLLRLIEGLLSNLVKPLNNETLSFLNRFRLGGPWDSKPRPVRTSPNHLVMGLRRRNQVPVKFLVQSSLVNDLPTKNSVADLSPSMMQQRCGEHVTLYRL